MQGTAETDFAVCKTHKKLIVLFMQGIAETDSDACKALQRLIWKYTVQDTYCKRLFRLCARHSRDWFGSMQGTTKNDSAVCKAQHRLTKHGGYFQRCSVAEFYLFIIQFFFATEFLSNYSNMRKSRHCAEIFVSIWPKIRDTKSDDTVFLY